MANGWLDDGANVEAVGSLALGARRFAAIVARDHGVTREDRGDADHRRALFLGRRADADPMALALSCASALADWIAGSPPAFRDRLPAKQQWFARTARQSLAAMRAALSSPEVAAGFGASAAHCASGILAADLERPDGLHDAVAALDGWTGHLLAITGYAEPEADGTTLAEAIRMAGGPPCAVFASGRPGFPVIVTGFAERDGAPTGFPTVGFQPADLWSRRPDWLRHGIVPDNGQAAWRTATARPEVLREAMIAFEARALPEMRRANAKALYVGAKALAEDLGVSVPRLAAWMRGHGLLVEGGEGWVPSPLLGRDTVVTRSDRMGRPVHLWSPALVDELRPRAAEIAATPVPRGPGKPPRPPSERQVAFLRSLHEQLGEGFPEGGYVDAKVASAAIGDMLRRKAAGPAPGGPRL